VPKLFQEIISIKKQPRPERSAAVFFIFHVVQLFCMNHLLFGFIIVDFTMFLGLFTAMVVLNLALVILLGGKDEPSKAVAVGNFLIFLWIIAVSLFQHSTNAFSNDNIKFFLEYVSRLTYYFGLLIAFSFFYFCYIFPVPPEKAHRIRTILIVISGLLMPIFFGTDLIVGGTSGWLGNNIFGFPSIDWYKGSLLNVYNLVFVGCLIAGPTFIYKKMKQVIDPILKKNMLFMFWGIVIGFIPPIIVNLILPTIGNNDYNVVGTFTPNLWAFIVGYSMMKYHQMNVRVVYSEVLIIAMGMILFVNIFLP